VIGKFRPHDHDNVCLILCGQLFLDSSHFLDVNVVSATCYTVIGQ
jgi:hypothetical protein